jgi:hypothetical protein
MPGSDEMIVRTISGTSNPRGGGGNLKIDGAVTSPSVLDDFEESLRDSGHMVVGDGASEQETKDAYKWGFSESITVSPDAIRNSRYEALQALLAAESAGDGIEAASPTADPPDDGKPDVDDSKRGTEPSESPETQATEANDSEVQA